METLQQWKLEDAKAQLSRLVESALGGHPQRVTRRGKPAVVVMAEAEYQELAAKSRLSAPSLVDHLLAMPRASAMRSSELVPGKVERLRGRKLAATAPAGPFLRDVDFS